MTHNLRGWKADTTLPAGKGGTLQRFVTDEVGDHLVIETQAWGEGDLKVNGEVVAHIDNDRDGAEAFHDLERTAEEYEDVKAALEAGKTGGE
ncbi:hypothetical protein KHP62_13570 [Rhodobacteraceae bacterium NNCM2]|nr:hypothetical protein [Coraliihabitans acroporae]